MKKTFLINPLYLSIIVIVLVWLQEIVRNIFFLDLTLNLYKSISQFLFYAFIIGILYVLVVTLLLRLSKEKYQDIGFDKQNIFSQIKFGVFFGLAIFILETFLITPIVDALLPKTAIEGIDKSKLLSNLSYLPILILLTLFKGGFSEELWRIFYLTRFQKYWGKTGLVIAVIIGSFLFGLGHVYQGIGTMISVVLVGFFYSLVYLRKKLALEVMIAHATFDIVAVLLGFIIYHGS